MKTDGGRGEDTEGIALLNQRLHACYSTLPPVLTEDGSKHFNCTCRSPLYIMHFTHYLLNNLKYSKIGDIFFKLQVKTALLINRLVNQHVFGNFFFMFLFSLVGKTDVKKVCIHCNTTFHSAVSLSNHLRAYARRKRAAQLEGTSMLSLKILITFSSHPHLGIFMFNSLSQFCFTNAAHYILSTKSIVLSS